jgi:Putative adhesin
MTTWQIEEPTTLDFERVTRLRVRTIRGRLSVVGTDERPRLEVSEVRGGPLTVRHHDDGGLEVGYDDWSRPGVLSWLVARRKWRRHAVVSLAVPRDCPVDLKEVASSVIVSGLRARVQVRVVSGDITLAGLAGPVDAETVSGAVEAHAIGADLRMRTISGDVTLAEGLGGAVDAETVSGAVTCDLSGAGDGAIRLSTISGDVVIRVPGSSDLDVRLQSTSGQVTSAFDGLRRSGTPGHQLVEGRLGAGTGRLEAKATSGNVALLRREAT